MLAVRSLAGPALVYSCASDEVLMAEHGLLETPKRSVNAAGAYPPPAESRFSPSRRPRGGTFIPAGVQREAMRRAFVFPTGPLGFHFREPQNGCSVITPSDRPLPAPRQVSPGGINGVLISACPGLRLPSGAGN